MYKIGEYNVDDSMSRLICDNYQMLFVMSRFGIALGIGNKTIGEVCVDNEIDTNTFLAVVNLLIDEDKRVVDLESKKLSISSLIKYLKKSHDYFQIFRLVDIRKKLIVAIDEQDNAAAFVIIKYFDEYVAEVKKHMNYEERVVFPYVESLIAGSPLEGYKIKIFSTQHDCVDSKLLELKDIIIKYYKSEISHELNSALFDIFTCSNELLSHNDVENHLFIPLVADLESKSKID